MMAIKPRELKLKGKPPEEIKPRKPAILLYGAAGAGKTWFSLDFPDVFYIDAEGGATRKEYRDKLIASGGHYYGPDDGATSFDEVMWQVKALATVKHDRKTLVIDSITKLFANEIAREADRLTDAKKKNEFGADKKPAVAYMRQLVSWLQRIDMNVILIAGEVPEWGQDDDGQRAQIGFTFDCWPRLSYELDLTIRLQKITPTKRLGRIGKSRVGSFPEASTFDMTYAEFSRIYGREVIEDTSTPVPVATAEQLEELSRLLELVRLDDGVAERWLAAANASAWDEVDTDKVAKVINNLNAKLKGAE